MEGRESLCLAEEKMKISSLDNPIGKGAMIWKVSGRHLPL